MAFLIASFPLIPGKYSTIGLLDADIVLLIAPRSPFYRITISECLFLIDATTSMVEQTDKQRATQLSKMKSILL